LAGVRGDDALAPAWTLEAHRNAHDQLLPSSRVSRSFV
jgi:hypothetical protein